MFVDLEKARFESAAWAASFEKVTMKEELLREISNNCELKARFSQSVSKPYSARKVKSGTFCFGCLGIINIYQDFSVTSDKDLREKKAKVAQVEKKFL